MVVLERMAGTSKVLWQLWLRRRDVGSFLSFNCQVLSIGQHAGGQRLYLEERAPLASCDHFVLGIVEPAAVSQRSGHSQALEYASCKHAAEEHNKLFSVLSGQVAKVQDVLQAQLDGTGIGAEAGRTLGPTWFGCKGSLPRRERLEPNGDLFHAKL